jgi:hypothetical protein
LAAVVGGAVTRIRQGYRLCSVGAWRDRVGDRRLGRYNLGRALQLPGREEGEAREGEAPTPAELLRACEGLAGCGAVLGGPSEVVDKLLTMLLTGRLQGRHISTYMLVRLGELAEGQAALALDRYAGMLARHPDDEDVCGWFVGALKISRNV